MKKLILIVFLFGCKQTATTTEEDGCEYYIFKTGGVVTAITHKGNCSNPIHQYIDTSDMVEPTPQFKIYVRRTDKTVRMDSTNLGAASFPIHSAE